MGLVATLLAACGIGGGSDDGPRAPQVAEGEAGLEQIRVEAVDLLSDLAPSVSRASQSSVEQASGAYRPTGNAGARSYYEYVAEADLTGGTFDDAAISEVLQEADLEVSTYDDPNGDRVVQGLGGGISATARNRPGDAMIRLQVKRSGALVEIDTAERTAELREETPIDLG